MFLKANFAKLVATFQAVVLGSLFSLGVSIYCDGFMKHPKEMAKSAKVSSCHESKKLPAKNSVVFEEKSSTSKCPIWSSLENRANSLAPNFQVSLPKMVEFVWGAELLVLAQKVSFPISDRIEPKAIYSVPIYLKNPTLRV
jgi:hypothetical protein